VMLGKVLAPSRWGLGVVGLGIFCFVVEVDGVPELKLMDKGVIRCVSLRGLGALGVVVESG